MLIFYLIYSRNIKQLILGIEKILESEGFKKNVNMNYKETNENYLA